MQSFFLSFVGQVSEIFQCLRPRYDKEEGQARSEEDMATRQALPDVISTIGRRTNLDLWGQFLYCGKEAGRTCSLYR
jgi:hypothetical protein